MVQRRNRARILFETAQSVGVISQRLGQHSDRDITPEPRVAELNLTLGEPKNRVMLTLPGKCRRLFPSRDRGKVSVTPPATHRSGSATPRGVQGKNSQPSKRVRAPQLRHRE